MVLTKMMIHFNVALFLVLPGEDAQDIEFEEEDEELSSSDGENSDI